uniref:Putative ubiquitin carboxyl-terminal hydrolase 36 n=1 Tax=uncultured bacterium Ad_091_F22_contig2 TaxID=1489284 RepID=A0A0B4N014_9BACT|nr:putative ubiquitin carboxyl-terminal hydrolase 36 [uncultured bacterium Ad_091_F22_contig2]
MAAFLPDEDTMLRIQVGPEQFVIGADVVADARDGLVLHVLFPVTEAQINGLGHRLVLLGEGNPAMDPDGRGRGGDGPEAVRPGGGPEGEKAAQGIPAQDDRPGAVSALQLGKKSLQDIVQRLLPMLPRLRVAGNVPVRPGHQVDGPVFQFDGHEEKGPVDEGLQLRDLGFQRGILVPGRGLHEDAVRGPGPELTAEAPGDGLFNHAFLEYSFATMAPLMLCQTLNKAPGIVASG